MSDPDEYLTRNPRGMQIAMWFVMGGIGALAMIMRLLATFLNPSDDSNSVAISSGIFGGMASISGLGLIAGLNCLRNTKRARLSPEGLMIESYTGARFIPWGNVAQIHRDKSQAIGEESSKQVLTLLDAQQKPLGKVTSDLDRFDELSSRIESMCAAARGAPVLDRAMDRVRRLKAQRKRVIRLGIMSGFLTLAGLTGLVWGGYMWIKNHQLASHGVDTIGHIDRHYMIRITGWVDFSFTDGAGKRFSRSVDVDKETWDQLGDKSEIAVRYLPSDPAWNHIAGEPDLNPAILLAGGAFLSALFGSFLLMFAMGYSDLKLTDGRFRFVRFGEDDLPEQGSA
jgi:hypothetical protein